MLSSKLWMISNGHFGSRKDPYGFWNFIFCQNFKKKIKRKLKFDEIRNDSWVRTDLKGFKFLDKRKFTFLEHSSSKWSIFGKNNRNSQNGSGFKNGQSKIGNFLDRFWSELIAIDRKIPRMWNFWNFRRFKKWPP